MITLGINAYHGDASACIVYNDKVIAAAEEERFNRIKHSAGFPFQAIKFCLQFSNLNLDQIDYVTINRDPKQKFLKKLLFATRNLFKLKFYKDRIDNLKKINSIKHQLESFFEQKFNGKVVNIDHHTSHIASSVFFSNYKKTNFISVDGFGDFTSTVIGHYDGETLIRFDETLFPHSLGILYTAVTQFLGFNNYGEEYKVMGLAPYGEPKFESKIRNLIISKDKGLFNLDLKYFLHHTGDVEMTWMDGEPKIGKIYSEHLVNLLGPERKAGEDVKKFHMDIASSVQKVYEDMFIEIVNKLYNFNNCDSLSISGGCGMNSVANGKILKKTNYKNVYLPSSPGDSGGAIGSAVFYINKHKNFRFFDDNPFKGPEYSSTDIEKILYEKKSQLDSAKSIYEKFTDKNDLLKKTAKLLTENKIVGFFQGRMEWGPRALGNRSILADPRNPNIRELLNLKIKRRESFRPFAPSILEEKTKEWFEYEDHVPFMSKVYQINSLKRKIIPAVTHVDGSGRLQTVSKNLNENYYHLIKYFYKLTDVPILLNTSFNENEPIVCSPQEALDCYLRTNMDHLVLENFIISR